MPRKTRRWRFVIHHRRLGLQFETVASSASAGCRRAFRSWIAQGKLGHQPRTAPDGSFEGISIQVVERAE